MYLIGNISNRAFRRIVISIHLSHKREPLPFFFTFASGWCKSLVPLETLPLPLFLSLSLCLSFLPINISLWFIFHIVSGLVTGIPLGQIQAKERKTLQLLNGKNDTRGTKQRAYNPPYDLIILIMREDLHRKQDAISWSTTQTKSFITDVSMLDF